MSDGSRACIFAQRITRMTDEHPWGELLRGCWLLQGAPQLAASRHERFRCSSFGRAVIRDFDNLAIRKGMRI